MSQGLTNEPPHEISICSQEQLSKARRISQWVEAWRDEVVVFDRSPHPLVISGVCPHFGGELDFNAAADKLRCRWHGWEFDSNNGACLTYPMRGCVRFFKSEWRGNMLTVFRNANP